MGVLLCSVLLAVLALAVSAWESRGKHKWYGADVFTETGRFLTSNGHSVRIPMRSLQQFLVIYGSADAEQVMRELESDVFSPVLVGGKAVVAVRLVNHSDTDFGNDEVVNPFIEAEMSIFVVPKGSPMSLPLEDWKSWESPSVLLGATTVASMSMRSTCGSGFGGPVPALTAISAGRGYGIPRHHVLGGIRFDYDLDGKFVNFNMVHKSLPVLSVRAKLPKMSPKAKKLPCDHDHRAAFLTPVVPVYQSRYGTAMNCTALASPWDDGTDEFVAHEGDDWVGTLLRRWNFQPKMKVHSTDAKEVTWRPINFLGPRAPPSSASAKAEL